MTLPDEKKPNDVSKSVVKGEKWGVMPENNFGYASDDERRAHRGLEDWEMVENTQQSQKSVPKWFIAVIAAVLLIAIGLSFPFWGDRVGYEREWFDAGMGVAILYLLVFGTFVYFMVTRYSPDVDGSDESESNVESDELQSNYDATRNQK